MGIEIGGCVGAALAAGDHDGDGIDDLAIGAPSAVPEGVEDAGSVFVLNGPLRPDSSRR